MRYDGCPKNQGERMFRSQGLLAGFALVAAASLPIAATAQQTPSGEPIKIGFGMGLTGGLAASGKAALLAMKIWEEEINAKGGLLGRPVKLIYYDDQSNPATVPGIYTKLLDVDKVDLVAGDYGTNLIAPAMPVVIQHKMTFFSLFGLDVNKEFQYPKYFSMQPAGGADPPVSFSKGFFELAAAQNPKPKTLAIIAADAEFPHNAADGARKNAKAAGLQDRLRQDLPAEHDRLHADRAGDRRDQRRCRHQPLLSARRGRHGARRQRDRPQGEDVRRRSGRAAIRLDQAAARRAAQWHRQLRFLGAGQDVAVSRASNEFLKKYQAARRSEGVDPLGYYLPPFAYANMQVLEQAVEGTKSLDQEKLADWLSKNTIKTIVGDIKYGPNGEWEEPRVLQVQFHDVKGSDLEQWKTDAKQTILWPDEYATGKINYPYTEAKKGRRGGDRGQGGQQLEIATAALSAKPPEASRAGNTLSGTIASSRGLTQSRANRQRIRKERRCGSDCSAARAPKWAIRPATATTTPTTSITSARPKRSGFTASFLVEHHFTGFGQVSATLSFLTYLAAKTTTLRLGTAVLVLPWHNPALLAEQAATLDLLSNGRFDFGIGKGYRWGEFHGFCIPMAGGRGALSGDRRVSAQGVDQPGPLLASRQILAFRGCRHRAGAGAEAAPAVMDRRAEPDLDPLCRRERLQPAAGSGRRPGNGGRGHLDLSPGDRGAGAGVRSVRRSGCTRALHIAMNDDEREKARELRAKFMAQCAATVAVADRRIADPGPPAQDAVARRDGRIDRARRADRPTRGDRPRASSGCRKAASNT